jgi:hypothetical protein
MQVLPLPFFKAGDEFKIVVGAQQEGHNHEDAI